MKQKPYFLVFPRKGSLKHAVVEVLGIDRLDDGLLNPTLMVDHRLGVKAKTLWHYIYSNKLHKDLDIGQTRIITIPKELVLKLKRLARRKPLTIQVKRLR